MRVKVLIWVFLFASALSFSQVKELNRAKKLVNAGKYKKALKISERVLEQDSENEDALFVSGYCYFHLGKYYKAGERIKKLLDVNDDRLDAYQLMFDILVAQRDFENARDITDKWIDALDDNKEKSRVYLLKASLEIASKRYGEAIKACDEAISLQPDNKDAYLFKIKVYKDKGNIDEVVKVYDSLIAILKDKKEKQKFIKQRDEFKLNTYFKLAKQAFKAKRYKLVVEYLSKIISKTKNYNIFILLANSYLLLGNYDKVIEICNKAVKLKKKPIECYLLFGLAYRYKNDFPNAIKYLQSYVKKVKKEAKPFYHLAYSLYKLSPNNAKKAMYYAKRSYAIKPDKNNTYLLGIINFKLKHYEKALSLLEKAKSMGKAGISDAINKARFMVSVSKGNRLFDKKKYEESAAAYKAALDIMYNDNVAISLASCYIKLGKYEEAIKLANNVLKNKKDFVSALNILAIAYKKAGQADKSAEIYKKIASLSKDVNAMMLYANTYELMNDYKKAIEVYENILKQNPKTKKASEIKERIATSYFNLASTAIENKKLDIALSYLKKCLKYNPAFEEAKRLIATIKDIKKAGKLSDYLNKAMVLFHEGKYDKALELYSFALQISPSIDIKLKMAKICYIIKRYDDMLVYLKEIEAEDKNNIEMLKLYLSYYLKQKNVDMLKRRVALIRNMSVKDSRLWTLVGDYYYSIGRFDEAITYYKKALKYKQANLEAMIGLGNTYYKKKAYDFALKQYKKVLKMSPRNITALNNMGYVLLKMNRLNEALNYLRRAVSLTSKYPVVFYNIARAYLYTGRYEKAISMIEKAISLNKDNIKYYFVRARAYHKLFDKLKKEEYKSKALADYKMCINSGSPDVLKDSRYNVFLLEGRGYETFDYMAKVKPIYPPIEYGDYIYVFNSNFNFVKMDKDSESRKWTIKLRTRFSCTPIITGDFIYIGLENGRLLVVDNISGKVLKRYRYYTDNIKLYNDKIVFYSKRYVYYIKGSRIINKVRVGKIKDFVIYNDKLFLIDSKGIAYILKGSKKYISTGKGLDLIYYGDGIMFMRDNTGKLIAFDTVGGKDIWKKPVRGIDSIYYADGKVFIVSGKVVSALLKLDGKEMWKSPFKEEIDAITYRSGKLFVIANDKLYIVNSITGKKLKEIKLKANNVVVYFSG